MQGAGWLTVGWAFAVEARPDPSAYAVISLIDSALITSGSGPRPPFSMALPWHVPAGNTVGLNSKADPGPVAVRCDLEANQLLDWGRHRDKVIAQREHFTPARVVEMQRVTRELRETRDRQLAENMGGSEAARKSRSYYVDEYDQAMLDVAARGQPSRPATSRSSLHQQLKRQRRQYAALGILPWAAFPDGHLPARWSQAPAFTQCYANWANSADPYPSNTAETPGGWDLYSDLISARQRRDATRAA